MSPPRLFPHLHFSLWVFSSSCAGFLKTWLPFLMLMGIILTVALALNLRWPGRQVHDKVEPLQVWCGADLLSIKGEGGGGASPVLSKSNRGNKDYSPLREDVQHMFGLWKAGDLSLALLQWWSWNALVMEIHLYSVIYFERRDWTLPPPTTTTNRTTQTHLMDYD